MTTRQLHRSTGAFLLGISLLAAATAPVDAQEPSQPTFRASVAVVPIAAVVRDSRNRVVRDLGRADFQVVERGVPRPIIEFSASDDTPLRLALLFDTSGSMGIVSNLERGKHVVRQLLDRFDNTRDEAALFTFHKTLRQEVPFTADRERLGRAVAGVSPWGLTSLYDAVAETAKRVSQTGAARSAIVVVSDGVDTSSRLTSSEVAALASAIDVPVYVVAVVSPLEDPTHSASLLSPRSTGALRDLAHQTGGEVFYVSAANPVGATDQLVSTLRHQYFLAIESSSAPGWYALQVTTKRKGLTVRARQAYSATAAAEANPGGR